MMQSSLDTNSVACWCLHKDQGFKDLKMNYIMKTTCVYLACCFDCYDRMSNDTFRLKLSRFSKGIHNSQFGWNFAISIFTAITTFMLTMCHIGTYFRIDPYKVPSDLGTRSFGKWVPWRNMWHRPIVSQNGVGYHSLLLLPWQKINK